MDKKNTGADEKCRQPKPKEEEKETNVEVTSEMSNDPNEESGEQKNDSVGVPTMSTVQEEDNVVVDKDTSETAREASQVKDKKTHQDGNKPIKDDEGSGDVTTFTAHCGVQLGRRQLRSEKRTRAHNECEMVSFPGCEDDNSLSASNFRIEDNDEGPLVTNSNVIDEEAALYVMPPLVERGSEAPNTHVALPPLEGETANEDVAPSVDVQDEAPSIYMEQNVQDPDNVAGEVDGATAVFSAYLAPTPEETRQRMLDNAVDAIHVRVVPTSEPLRQNKWKTPLVVASVLVIATLAISLGVTISGRNNNDSSATISPTPAPTSARFGQAASLVESLFNTTVEDMSAPEYQATQWIADEDALFKELDGVNPDRFRQRYVLALFYFATGGPTSWLETSFFLKPDVHECKWRDMAIANTQAWSGSVGVVNCTSDKWVTGIEINQNNLTGTLPAELGSLSSLAELTVFQNSIGGTLPSSIFNLSDLEWLLLWSNEFTGTIPTEVGQATSLQFLLLRANFMTGTIPSEIGNCASLLQLDLQVNSFTGSLPETLLLLSNITHLALTGNSLTGTLPGTIWASLPNLETFGVLDNQMSGTIPNNLNYVPHLEELSLTKNNFTGPFPSSVVKLTKVAFLDMALNTFTGSLPYDWTNLSSTLDWLQVGLNRLTGTLPELGSLTKLTNLVLMQNDFIGTIPASFGNLTMLRSLQFSHDSLTGTVPASFVRLSSLQSLALYRSKLTGDLSFLCNGTEMLFPDMKQFGADCIGVNAQVTCPCCTRCCNIYDTCHDKSGNDWIKVVP